ncbi:MAG: hypothetical protein ACYTFW_07675 [Planctomycetota bacterium]|jgi:hypothetical protein
MEKSRAIILVLVMAIVLTTVALPCPAAEKDKTDKDDESIWTDDESRGPGPGRGPGRGRRFDLTEEEIDQIIEGLKQRDPEKAKELAKLREENPEKFIAELRRHAGEEFGKVIRERIEQGRQKRRADFLKWLGENVPKEAEELSKLKDKDPDLYTKKYDLLRRKYGRIFEESRRNPELAEVLLEDLQLQKRRDELLGKINSAGSERQKKRLIAELEEVVSDRYDLIVRRKQIAYERLLKWLEELRNRIRESRTELLKWRDDEAKAENVKQRTKELLEGKKGFNWD